MRPISALAEPVVNGDYELVSIPNEDDQHAAVVGRDGQIIAAFSRHAYHREIATEVDGVRLTAESEELLFAQVVNQREARP